MSNLMNIFNVAGSAMSAQAQRLNVTASNLANADSTRGPTVSPTRPSRSCSRSMRSAARAPAPASKWAALTGVVDDPSPMKTSYDPSNPAANADGYVTLPNVGPVQEMVNMISASRSYQANVETLNTAKQLMLKTLTIGT